LRERAMAQLAAGDSSSRVAAALNVALLSVIKWAARAQRLGSVAPGCMGGHRPFASRAPAFCPAADRTDAFACAIG
jgi:transposase